MSSGNPFRASLSYNPAASSPVPQTSFTTADSSVPGVPEDGRSGLESAIAPPLKTKKHVRIESNTTFIPPHPASDEGDASLYDPLAQKLNQSRYVDPSSAVPPTSFSNNTIAPATPNTQATGNEMAMADVWSGPRRDYQAPLSATSPSGIPANPFSRTLASIESQERGSGDSRTGTDRVGPGNNRASLDVESFKNLLMTGKPGPRQSGLTTQTTAPPSGLSGTQFESSSSTDTSSISRHSLFEPPQEAHPESPRTSYEMAESDEDEIMGLVSEVKKGKKKPPPAPKHRHGKLVTPRQPQIVSFESFSATEPAPAPAPVTRPRDHSDVNKPLPPTPVISPQPLHISSQDATQEQPTPFQQRSSESLAISDVPRPQKKAPPPVPLARRQSQLRSSTTGNRSRSSSSLTISSQQSVDAVSPPSPAPSNKDPLSVAKSPPPPPRSRHGARLTDISTSSANSSSTELPQRSNSTRTATPSIGPTSSRRSTMDSEPASSSTDLRRTSSMASSRNPHRTVSNESTSSLTMPPPPPPPRRRQSNRSSLDHQRPYIPSTSPTESRRTSTENRRTSLDSKRRTSVASESSLRHEYAPSAEKSANSEYALYSPHEDEENKRAEEQAVPQTRSDSGNILDDMERFQREIEELRLRYDKAT